MEIAFYIALGILAVLATQHLSTKARRARKALRTKTRHQVRRARRALGTQTVATTRRRKSRKGGR